MDNHPIPQDITGFKFKLIGSITVKQFSYLVGAAIIGYLILLLPIFIFIRVPLVFLVSTAGFALAFLPIDGRPLDKMVINYIKAIPSENQYVYRKTGANLSFLEATQSVAPRKDTQTLTKEKLQLQKVENISTLFSKRPKTADFDKHELTFLKTVKDFFEESVYKEQVPQKGSTVIKQTVTTTEQNKEKQPAVYAVEIPQRGNVPPQIIKQPTSESKSTVPIYEVEGKIKELQTELSKSMQEKELLQKRFFELAKQKPTGTVYKPSQQNEAQQETPRVRTITGQASINAGFPTLPDTPNILLGIVKDPRGKMLPGMLVEVFDKNDIPVRAFKTNGLGQFASATPLPNGTYKIRFEDPQKRNEFDIVEITLTGIIFQPIEVFSVDAREKLRRELFEEVN